LERQVQISEWTYQDKLETLFIFQFMYIGLLVLILFMVLAKLGFFRTGFVYLIGVVIAIVIFAIWLFRSAYTKNIRDKREWNRRRFPGDGSTNPAVPAADVAAAAKETLASCAAASAN
jgi:Ca2+/Na+ antiporter